MLELGQKGPEFSLPGVDGQTYSLSGLLAENKAVAVIFSCNHCPYVRAWEGRMMDIQREYQDKGVVLAAINSNDAQKYPDDAFPKMQNHAQSEGFNFLYLYDESQEIARAYGGTHTPHVFLLDGNGVLRYRGAIDDNYDDPDAVTQTYLRDALDAVLAGNAPATTDTRAVGCTIKWK
ncbi:MAG: thioredoxin family protein [Anaerolineae bacterium]|nr:thioredoxin family protein [Anaerolineae bacterium]